MVGRSGVRARDGSPQACCGGAWRRATCADDAARAGNL